MLHLIHPAVVHFSVVFLVVGASCEIWGLTTRRPSPTEWGGGLTLLGLASLLPTVISGYLAANTVELSPLARALLETHERTGLIVLGLLLASQFWKAWSGGRLEGPAVGLYVSLLAAVVLGTIYGAWLGGRLVYGHGVGVLA